MLENTPGGHLFSSIYDYAQSRGDRLLAAKKNKMFLKYTYLLFLCCKYFATWNLPPTIIREINMNQINFHEPPLQVYAFSESQLLFYVEACIDLLEKQGHQPGVLLLIESEDDQQVRLVWRDNFAKSPLSLSNERSTNFAS